MDDDEPIGMTHDELLVLAGLVRVTVEADERIDLDEVRAIAALHRLVAERNAPDAEGGTYRTTAARDPLDRDAWAALWDESARAFPSVDGIRAAAKQIDRRAAREAIFALVSDIAAADTIQNAEWAILDWLAETWGLAVNDAPA